MMGEPLEVPQQQEQQHQNIHHQQTIQSLIPPSTTVEDCWDSQQSSRSSSSSTLPLVPASSFGGQGSTSGAKGPRRTRHRVDAGEPRGCFNSANNSSFFQPRNIFTSPISNSNSVRGQHSTNSSGGGASPLNSTNSPNLNSSNSPYHHHHHPLNHQFNPQHLPGYSPNPNNLQGAGHFNPNNPAGLYTSPGGPKGQDAYYFQPMKMLSEFISTQQAAAAAAAAAAVAASAGNSAASVGGGNAGVNGQQFPGGVVPPHQLLLREMLSKSNGRNNPNANNNNNNLTKCGYEEDVVMDGDGDQKSGEKAEVGGGNLGIKDEELEGQSSTAGDSGAEDGNLVVKVETGLESKLSKSNGQSLTSSSSTSTSSGKSAATTTSTSGMRINGCKKRKLYQPQQRSDFDEAEEEELDDDDYDSNVLEAAMARSRQKDSPPILSDSPINPPTELVPEEDDEEEEMRLMDEKEDFDENFEDDDDDEDLVTSNRTTPNNNNVPSNLVVHNNTRGGSNSSGVPGNAAAAPLTRQLLTERSSNEQKPSSLSLLRTSSSPKIVLNSNGNRENIRRREEIMNHFDHNVPFGANPQAYFYTWKENFKSTLITHITDLVDSQFSLLFPGQSQGQAVANHNMRENNNREVNRMSTPASLLTPTPHRDSHNSHLHNHHHHQGGEKGSSRGNSMERATPQKNPASLLLNGGTVCSNNNNNNNNTNNNNNNTREKFSPPAEKIPKLDLRGNKNNDFHGHGPQFPRYPFQVHPGNVNNASLPTGREQNGPAKGQNFSSALMGLSQAAQMQHHAAAAAAAAAAAGLSADMFDDGPLSLVVRGHSHETPRKKRHKVTDTRLTPRAVSRLLGQVDNYGDHHSSGGSPSRRDLDSRGVTPPPNGPSSGGSGGQANLPQSLPTSVAIPNPSLNDSRLFTPYAPLFHHHPGHPGHHRLDSPPMGTSLIHPALLANPAEYVQQLRAEMSREERNADLRESRDHIRAVRDSGSISCGGGPGSAGSDSGETNSYADLPGSLYSCGTTHSSSTLTPMHLRKAKLMFFWVRYPSSSVIKMYFPDIKFNKNNTAQLVKWFSNFREFYYIQMEKYARQALSEGIKNAEDLHVTTDNELYRVLNLHYNRNNHIEVPTNFRFVVEQTLREFFKAIQQGKDQEQSWKKAIYKIIARLDDPVPEYFKSPNFLEQLE